MSERSCWIGLAVLMPCWFGFIGCGSTDDANAGDSGGENQFVAQAATLACSLVEGCCAEKQIRYDRTVCEYMTAVILTPGRGVDNVTYDPDAAAACLAALEAGPSCRELVTGMDPCRHVYSGTLPPGSPCEEGVQCAEAASGRAHCDMMSGLCGVTLTGSEGDPCTRTCETSSGGATVCSFTPGIEESAGETTVTACYLADGLFCSSEGRCAREGAVGAPCDGDDTCVPEAYCAFAAGPDSYTCEPRVAVGEFCAGSDRCVPGAYCAADALCAVQLPSGAACTGHEDCESGYCDCPVSQANCETGSGVCRDSYELNLPDLCGG